MRNGRQSECVWEISVPFVDVQKRETKEGKERGKGEEESHGHQEIAPRDIITRRRSCGCDSWPSAKVFSTTTSVRLWFCCPFLSNSSCSLTEKKNLRWIQQIVFFFSYLCPKNRSSVDFPDRNEFGHVGYHRLPVLNQQTKIKLQSGEGRFNAVYNLWSTEKIR